MSIVKASPSLCVFSSFLKIIKSVNSLGGLFCVFVVIMIMMIVMVREELIDGVSCVNGARKGKQKVVRCYIVLGVACGGSGGLLIVWNGFS